MKQFKTYLAITLLTCFALSSCNRVDESKSDFDNVAYIEAAAIKSTEALLLKNTDTEIQKILQASLALPADKDINVSYKVDFSLVGRYNAASYVETQALPNEFFELSDNKALIPAGMVRSSNVTVRFKNLENIPRGTTFVLPVTIESVTEVSALESAKTIYYTVKKGAPIVVAANINHTFLQLVNSTGATSLANLDKLTMEALIRPHEWGTEAGISTVMGVENYFLIRIGDSGFPTEQIQISKGASYGGNWPPMDESKKLKKDIWQHIALTFDLTTREMVIYVDGRVQSRAIQGGTGTAVSFNRADFYIGKSWSDNRPLRGEICEARIWNTVRSQEEISSSRYYVASDTPGLVAYWKFDEGNGNNVNDYTENENHLTVGLTGGTTANPITWIPVEVGME